MSYISRDENHHAAAATTAAAVVRDAPITKTIIMAKNETPNPTVAAATMANKPIKPTRPLTAYHLFFQLEREYILQTTESKDDTANFANRDATSRPSSITIIKKEDTRPIGKELDPNMPFRYRYIHLNPHWYASGSGKRLDTGSSTNGKNSPPIVIPKRKHRKTHGKISFLDLSKRIATAWADLERTDKVTKTYVSTIAMRELEIYKWEMKLFKESNNRNVNHVALASPSTTSTTSVPKKSAASFASSDATASFASSQQQSGNASASLHGVPKTPKTTVKLLDDKAQRRRHSMTRRVSIDTKHRVDKTDVEERIATTNHNDSSFDDSSSTKDNAAKKESSSSSFTEFSFHPVPSSYWRKYKMGRARRGRGDSQGKDRRRSRRDGRAKKMMSSRSFPGPYSVPHNSQGTHDFGTNKMNMAAPLPFTDSPTSTRSHPTFTAAEAPADHVRGFQRRSRSSVQHGSIHNSYAKTTAQAIQDFHRSQTHPTLNSSSSSSCDYRSIRMDLENEMDTFLSSVDRDSYIRSSTRGGRYPSSSSSNPISPPPYTHPFCMPVVGDGLSSDPPSGNNITNCNKRMEVSSPKRGLLGEDTSAGAVHITSDDAMGLMRALSEG